MSFKITIEETTNELKICGKEWAVLETAPDGSKEHGYTPEITKMIDIEHVVYTQVVSELSLVSVINAVNGIV